MTAHGKVAIQSSDRVLNDSRDKSNVGFNEFLQKNRGPKVTKVDVNERQITMLDLNSFKTILCQNSDPNHNLKKCGNYHEKTKDRRRPPGNYKSELCSYIAKKN